MERMIDWLKVLCHIECGHLGNANGGGDFIQVESRHMMAEMINAYQVTEIARERPVVVHVANDGAMFQKLDSSQDL